MSVKFDNCVFVAKIIIFIVVAGLLFSILSKRFPKPEGDGTDYVLMTESFYQHGSPNVIKSDIDTFLVTIKKFDCCFYTYALNQINNDISKTPQPDSLLDVYFKSKQNNQFYNYHFWFYSLLIVPGRAVCGFFGANPMHAFSMTNAFFVLCVFCYILFNKNFALPIQICGAFVFLFSSVYWYVLWPHTEVFTACFLALSLLLFFDGKYFLAILLSSLASMQNPPIVFITIIYIVRILYTQKITFKNLFFIGVSAIWVVLPMFFYWYHFEKSNLIVDKGYLSSSNISIVRFFGFFVDLDQGIIVALPILFLFYIVLLVRKLVVKRLRDDYTLFFAGATFLMLLFPMQMYNWNCGQAIVNRYVVWISTVYVILVLKYINEINHFVRYIFIAFLALTTVTYTIMRGNFETPSYDSMLQKNTSVAAMNLFPNCYIPDPMVFRSRVEAYVSNPIIIFRDYNGIPLRILAHKDTLKWLLKSNFLKPISIPCSNDWIYISQKEITRYQFQDIMEKVVHCNFENFDREKRTIKSEFDPKVDVVGDLVNNSYGNGNFAVKSKGCNGVVCKITINDLREKDNIYLSVFLKGNNWLYCRLISKSKLDTIYCYGNVKNFNLPVWQFDKTTIYIDKRFAYDTAYLELMSRENSVVYDNIVVLKTKHQQ